MPTRSDLPPTPSPGRPAGLVLAFFTLLAVGTDLFVVSPLLPDIARAYGVGAAGAGESVTAFSLAYMVAAPFTGSLADRVGRRRVLALGLVSFAASNVLTALAPTFVVLLGARVLAGISASSITPSVLALVGQTAPPAKRARWMSVAMAGFLISLTTGAPSGTAAATVLGWRYTFVGIGLLAAVLAAANALAWRGASGGVAPVRTGGGAAPVRTGGDPVGVLTKVRAVSVTGVWALSVYAFYTYLGTALGAEAGFSPAQIEIALVVFGVGAVAGSLAGGWLTDRFGSIVVTSSCFAVLAVAHLLVGVFLRGHPGPLVAVLLLFALAAYPTLPSYQSRLVSHFGSRCGSVLAWNSSFLYLGTSLGAAAGGVVLSRWGFTGITVVGAITALVGIPLNSVLAISRCSPGPGVRGLDRLAYKG